MSKAELVKKRKDLIDAYRKEHQELVDAWMPRMLKCSGLDGCPEFRREERKIEKVFAEKLRELDKLIKESINL